MLLRWTLFSLMFFTPLCQAQVHPGRLGVGAWAGNQSGLAAKYYTGPANAYEALLFRDDNQIVALNTHLLHEAPISRSPLTYFVGFGGFISLLDTGDAHFAFGPSSSAGLNFFTHRFEVFLQAIPYLQLSPNVDTHLGLGAGLRYYF